MAYAHFDEVFQITRYPAGEPHVQLRAATQVRLAEIDTIEARVRHFDDLCLVLTADRILRHNRVGARWFLPYFPFARHDRRIDGRDGLELELALDLVRGLDVTIADPHSDVAGQLRHIPQHVAVRCLEEAGAFEGHPVVIIPDAGATKKAETWLGARDFVQCAKRRDPRTGQLSGFDVAREDLGGVPCIIVDDLCDRGGTFLGIADQLAERNAGALTLAVTHGLFTQGLDELAKRFDRLFAFGPRADQEGPLTRLAFQALYDKGVTQ